MLVGFLEAPIRFELMNKGFADLGLTTWLWHRYFRIDGASGRNRTNDTGIFSPLLYRLSYRGTQLATRMGLEPTTSSVTG